jgi:molybdate transport system substrate-binding protein
MLKLLISTILFSTLLFSAQKPTLLFYCGITMVKPMKEIAKIIEKKHNCNIKISQGGSKDLYDSLKYSKVGDLYLPGSDSYIKKNKKDGYLLDSVDIGYNQAAIFVQKNNPKKVKGLDSLVDENLRVILCDPASGSIGKNTKKILTKYKGEEFFEEAFDNAADIGTDSRNLNRSLIENEADVTVNWRATGFWDNNSKYIDVVSIDEKYAPKKKLALTLLSFSKNKSIAKDFMKFATSKDGQEIMKKHGFLD